MNNDNTEKQQENKPATIHFDSNLNPNHEADYRNSVNPMHEPETIEVIDDSVSQNAIETTTSIEPAKEQITTNPTVSNTTPVSNTDVSQNVSVAPSNNEQSKSTQEAPNIANTNTSLTTEVPSQQPISGQSQTSASTPNPNNDNQKGTSKEKSNKLLIIFVVIGIIVIILVLVFIFFGKNYISDEKASIFVADAKKYIETAKGIIRVEDINNILETGETSVYSPRCMNEEGETKYIPFMVIAEEYESIKSPFGNDYTLGSTRVVSGRPKDYSYVEVSSTYNKNASNKCEISYKIFLYDGKYAIGTPLEPIAESEIDNKTVKHFKVS